MGVVLRGVSVAFLAGQGLPDDTGDEQLDLLFLWRLKRGAGVPADVIACRASEFREACDTVNTLSYTVATEGVRIDDR